MVPVAVLDANVLFPMILRDTLLRVAAAGCFRAHWSGRIRGEMAHHLINQHRVTKAQAERLQAEMRQAFPEADVEGWEALEATMPNDSKDRHVAAAAAQIDADLIITANLKDFAVLPGGLRAVDPDTFLHERFSAMPDAVLEAIRKQAAAYRHPPASLDVLLDWLASETPDFVDAVRAALGSMQ